MMRVCDKMREKESLVYKYSSQGEWREDGRIMKNVWEGLFFQPLALAICKSAIDIF